ncbi:MAG: ABC transporter substrate-binding protein [Vicingaceae bacterium]
MKQAQKIELFSLLIFLFLAACQTKREYQGKSIFRYNISAGVSSLDPAFARSLENVSTSAQLFNGLVQMDKNLKVKACIAKEWQILDSGKTYQFTLRQDVYFHEHELWKNKAERKVKASDFVYALNRLIDNELISPGKWVMNAVKREEDGRLKVKAVNDSTLQIKLKKPFPPFLGILSMQYCAVVPQKIVEHFGNDFRSNPIGTGPFQFQYWKENTKLVLLKNEEYFEIDASGKPLPYLDAISISFIKDEEVGFLKFLKGEQDYLSGLKGSYKDELLDAHGNLRPKYQGQFRLIQNPYLNTEYLGFYQAVEESHPLKDKRIRKAINYGFDRQKMLKYLRNGIGYPAHSGFVPKGLPSFDSTLVGYSYQPDSVKALLQAAGYPNGKGLPTITLSTTAQYLDLCEYIQHQLKEFGIPIEVAVNQAATNNEMIAFGKLDFFRKSWVADYPDAENYLSLFYTENFAPEGPNYTHYSNTEFDSLYRKSMQLPQDEERWKLYRQMDSLILEDAPVVPLFYDEVVRFIPHYISGIGVNPMNLLVLKYAKKKLEKGHP